MTSSRAANRPDGAATGEVSVTISADQVPEMAIADLVEGARHHEMWWNFALHDIRQRFRRSMLGPFWITLSMGVMVGALALVFGAIFAEEVEDFLPYLAVGLIFWNLLTTTINEGCLTFIAAEGYVRNVPMPLSVHFYRLLARNLIVWVHNMVIYAVVFAIAIHSVNPAFLLAIPGLILFTVNLAWMSLMAGILSTRFRDIPQLISNALQVVFFVTPIFWSISQFPDRPIFVLLNPAYHLLEVVRAPFLGQAPGMVSWAVAVGMALVGVWLTALLYRRAYPRIPYWV